jgi:hypothetical protein
MVSFVVALRFKTLSLSQETGFHETSRGFYQSFQAKGGIVCQLGYGHFLISPFQFMYHLTPYSLDTDSAVK